MHIYLPTQPPHLFSAMWMFQSNHSLLISARQGRLLCPAGTPGSPQPPAKPSLSTLAPSCTVPQPWCTCNSSTLSSSDLQGRLLSTSKTPREGGLCLAAPQWVKQGCCKWSCTKHPRWEEQRKIQNPPSSSQWGGDDCQINCFWIS